ncbi:YfhD family protein [Cohnella sp. CFH 77786]|uniref:YfhD family protein n=1 Tax=Cohnella sp. CFH 77786 TaxID=2662265 RepID=UPI001C60B718|nr:YfhD family protein [Cohnella sp. CFH 77786]MBW5444918.1 YfhD family protein [Cohnella sp. CFH 77786]
MSEQPINRQSAFRQAVNESLPTASAEDVEFSEELADQDDREAQQRAAEADRRAAAYEGD